MLLDVAALLTVGLRGHLLIIVSLVNADDPAVLHHLLRLAHGVDFLRGRFLLAWRVVNLENLLLINRFFLLFFFSPRRHY